MYIIKCNIHISIPYNAYTIYICVDRFYLPMTKCNMNSHDFLNILHVCGLRPMVSVIIYLRQNGESFSMSSSIKHSFWLRMLLKCLCSLPFSYNFSRMVNLWKQIPLSMGAFQILILLISVGPKNRNPWSRVQKSLIIEIDSYWLAHRIHVWYIW